MVIGLIFILTGCTSLSGSPERSADINTELAALMEYLVPEVITTYNAKATDAEKKTYRDEVIAARIRAVDLNYNEFVKKLSEENKKLNIGADSAILLLGGAGAASTVSGMQTVLAATSSTVSGVKTSIDKNSYYDSAVSALIAQMQASRKEVLVSIYTGLELGVDQYPLMKALIDIETYYQAGTLFGAVGEITKSSGEQKAKADQELSNIIKGQYAKDRAGDRIRAFWKPDGRTIDSSNESRLKFWMKNSGIDNTSITLFLRAGHLAEARAKAIQEIPIP